MTLKFRSAEIIENLSDLTIVQHVEHDGLVWATHNRNIYKIENGQRELVAVFPRVFPRDLFAIHRLAARAARADKCNVYVNRHGQVLGIRGSTVYAIEDGKVRPLGTINGDCTLHRGICEDPDGNMYFGEYFMNPSRIPVRIWRVSTDWQCEICYEFTDPKIRHVHGVFRDPYADDSLWVTTGDYSGECYIMRTRDRFATLEKFGDGEQLYRAVTIYFTPEHITWVTDSHIEQNYACRLNRVTGELEKGQEIDASSWYGTTTREGLHVAFTTVEGGPAIKTNWSSVLTSEDGFEWTEVYRFKKDAYRPLSVFKFGVLSCPSGDVSCAEFYLSGEGLVGIDGKSVKLAIRQTDTPADLAA